MKRLLVLMLFTSITLPIVYAQPANWNPIWQNEIFVEAKSVQTADLDMDGDPDILATSLAGDQIAWWENDGSANPWPSHAIDSYDEPWGIWVEDIDGDGDPDFVVAGYTGNTTSWYENDGTANFTQHILATDMYGGMETYATDMDGDGDIDLLASAIFAPAIRWWEQTEPGVFGAEHEIAAFAGWSLYADDLDSDGDMDVTSSTLMSSDIVWFRNDGNDTWTMFSINDTAYDCKTTITADMDADGDPDVLASANAWDKLAWFERVSDDSWIEHMIDDNFRFANSQYPVDMDFDGDLDVVGASEEDFEYFVAWYENDGNDTWIRHGVSDIFSSAEDIWATDMDGDYDIDIISVSDGLSTVAWWENTTGPQAPNVYLSLTSMTPVVPADGGTLSFDATILNTTGAAQTGEAWTEVTLPDGNDYGPLVRTPLTLQPGETTITMLSQPVPAGAPAGTYIFHGNLGAFPNVVVSSDNFSFEKNGVAAAAESGWPGLKPVEGDPVSATAEDQTLPEDYSIDSVYPNPFNATVTLRFGLPESGPVSMTVFDITGREVEQLVYDETLGAGYHQVSWNAGGHSSGVYFAELHAGAHLDRRKLVLLR